ncbi:DUF397 domain-containing protein [Allorhizocola rhizosphaerae]|uniref:DUF397 domain-containing protein n=1 Tax=Allorhizocola rhizosphaerae TaxID=1872709 RepID=UPI000E3C1A38|nr:DUF397 domain-containing protein [Allorhizocola rhizosphaerae]
MSDAPETERLRWRKSSRSTSAGNCVEVAQVGDGVAVRDSKDPAGPRFVFSQEIWRDFVADIRAGRFDGPAQSG